MSYEQLANEYYDNSIHPTCRNFRDASARYIDTVLPKKIERGGLLVDVGVGRSVLSELLLRRDRTLANVLLLDSAPTMLEHSHRFQNAGALLAIADATSLPLRSHEAALIVASLGDAFNVQNFWIEVARCLRPGGLCVFTAPAFEWAETFRRAAPHECENLAYFELADGRSLYVPSIVYSAAVQRRLIESASLRVVDVCNIGAVQIPAPYSPKILAGRRNDPVVVGYSVVAPDPL